jgi:hypothetical protein
MKTIAITFMIQLLMCSCLPAQNNFNTYYNKYKDTPGVISDKHPVQTDGIEIKGNTGDNFWTFYKKFEEIGYIIAENPGAGLLNEMKTGLPLKGYRDLGKIDKKYGVRFRELHGGRNEILMIDSSSESIAVICITGTFSYHEVESNFNSLHTFLAMHNIVFAEE